MLEANEGNTYTKVEAAAVIKNTLRKGRYMFPKQTAFPRILFGGVNNLKTKASTKQRTGQISEKCIANVTIF